MTMPPDGAAAALDRIWPGGVLATLLVSALLLVAVLAVVVARSRHHSDDSAGTRRLDQGRDAQPEAVADQGATGLAAAPSGSDWTHLIAAYDLAVDDDERTDIGQQLTALGVIELQVEPGDPLDARRHNVIGRHTAEQRDQVRTIATVERPGWRSTDAVSDENIRPADVTVWA